jgi:hypothetical protein
MLDFLFDAAGEIFSEFLLGTLFRDPYKQKESQLKNGLGLI